MAGSRCQSTFWTSCFSSGVPLLYDDVPVFCTVDTASFSGISEAVCSGLPMSTELWCFRSQFDKSRPTKSVFGHSPRPFVQHMESQ